MTGMFQVKVRLTNPHDPKRTLEEMFRVDTGALYSFAPGEQLTAIGLAPKVVREFILADGRRDRRPRAKRSSRSRNSTRP